MPSAPTRMSLRSRLRDGEILVGIVVKMPNPSAVEMVAGAGLDYVLIDGEHGAIDVVELEHHIRAADAWSLPVLVRVPVDGSSVQHALDAGAVGVIFPHVENHDQAVSLDRSARYAPDGSRGLATSTRAGGYGALSVEELLREADDTLTVAQIESLRGLQALPDILAAGVDVAFVGPTDLAHALRSSSDAPRFEDAVHSIAARVSSERDVALGAFATSAADAETFIALGAQLIALPINGLLRAALLDVTTAIRHADGGIRR